MSGLTSTAGRLPGPMADGRELQERIGTAPQRDSPKPQMEPVAEKGYFSLSDLAYEKLMAAVIEERFQVNTKLPPETELAQQLGVSRPVLRMALQRLKADGLLASRRGSGNYVIRRPHQTMLEMVRLNQVSDIQSCFKYRVGVEGESAYYAALSKDKNALHKIERSLLGLSEAIKNKVPGVEQDFAYHLNIALATENHYFVSALMIIRAQFTFGISLTHNLMLQRYKERLLAVHEEHEVIYDAIARGEAAAAREAMRAHIENSRHRIFEGVLEEDGASEEDGR